MSSTDAFRRARDYLLQHREDYEAAYRGFSWPALARFNWAFDWFDVIAQGNRQLAVHIVEDDGQESRLTYGELAERSSRVAVFLRRHGVERGDRMLVMLSNCLAIWELMLAAMKLGAVFIPATTLLTDSDLRDRLERGQVKHVVTDAASAEKMDGVPGGFTRIVLGEEVAGWLRYERAYDESAVLAREGETHPDDPFLLYFTSGTTAKPKLVLHTHSSYPVGHLSTMYWIGLREGDVHMNVSPPGWGKHAWSSVFAPFNAGATAFVHNYARFNARRTLEVLARRGVTSICAPPTWWRFLILEDLATHPVRVREALSAGEPLNPEVIDRVREGWGITVRDGYGQTETTCAIGNSPGQTLKPGSMGRPMPGYQVALLDAGGRESNEGELSLSLRPRPAGLMVGYLGDPNQTQHAMRGGHYHTGDIATRDEDGYVTYVGRADDLFKSSDYRISPFELESALIEHDAIAEAAVVPSADAIRGVVPKAYLILKPGQAPSRELALEVFRFVRRRLAPYQRVRRIEFSDLPKTISGKISRAQLRAAELLRNPDAVRGPAEFWEEDLPELRDSAGR